MSYKKAILFCLLVTITIANCQTAEETEVSYIERANRVARDLYDSEFITRHRKKDFYEGYQRDDEGEEREEGEEDEEEEDEKKQEMTTIDDITGVEWVQWGTVLLCTFGFMVLGFQLTFGLTDPPGAVQQNILNGFGRQLQSFNVFRTVLDSIDPVDLSFGVLNIDSLSCRKKTICQMRKAIAEMSYVEELFKRHGPKYESEIYREAINAGENRKDCSHLFSTCTSNPFQEIYYKFF